MVRGPAVVFQLVLERRKALMEAQRFPSDYDGIIGRVCLKYQPISLEPVSYTHLTLPTIYSV